MAKKKTPVSEFAQKQLEKCGWKEGSGLGRAEHGITEAVKVNLKRDQHGIGHDVAKEHTHHWWNHVYNKAAAKIQVKQTEGGDVHFSIPENGDASKVLQAQQATNALYKNFVKSATSLHDGVEVTSDHNSHETKLATPFEDDEKLDNYKRPTDEDLFRICGGRTTHKGARHGLKLNGKLARVAAQEAAMMTTTAGAATAPAASAPAASALAASLTQSSAETTGKSTQDRSAESEKKRKRSKKISSEMNIEKKTKKRKASNLAVLIGETHSQNGHHSDNAVNGHTVTDETKTVKKAKSMSINPSDDFTESRRKKKKSKSKHSTKNSA